MYTVPNPSVQISTIPSQICIAPLSAIRCHALHHVAKTKHSHYPSDLLVKTQHVSFAKQYLSALTSLNLSITVHLGPIRVMAVPIYYKTLLNSSALRYSNTALCRNIQHFSYTKQLGAPQFHSARYLTLPIQSTTSRHDKVQVRTAAIQHHIELIRASQYQYTTRYNGISLLFSYTELLFAPQYPTIPKPN